MSLTFKNIWDRYSHVLMTRRMYIKRLKEDGSYESDFTEISQGLMKDGSVQSLNRSLPNNSWQFGYVTVSNIRLEILSAFQEFASELDPNSIFFGFIRHRSIVKIVDAFIDKYTDPDVPVEAAVTAFIGLIDSNTATTEQGYETITALDFLSTLKEINVKDLNLTETTLNDLIYEVMNRSEFTKFFNVSNSTTYINAGYDAQNIVVAEYENSVLEMLEDLAKGHSIFFIDPDDNYFYFKPADPTVDVKFSFLEDNNRKLDVSSYREGIDRQITNWYWEDSDVVAIQDPPPVNPRIGKFKIDGITDDTQRKNTLDVVLSRTKDPKPYFKLDLPYLPIVKILDRVEIQSFGSAPRDAVRWGMFVWTSKDTSSPSTAPRWRKPAGIRISKDDNWMVRSIAHDKSLRTTLEVEKILT